MLFDLRLYCPVHPRPILSRPLGDLILAAFSQTENGFIIRSAYTCCSLRSTGGQTVSPMKSFLLQSQYQPTGDQPQAIDKLASNILNGADQQTLLGVTGSGKTFTMAHVIARVQKPTLVIAPNKTLGAQLYGEFRSFFPENAVEYFVSYYDYYQPEAYVPQTDTYIAKDSSINETIDKMRHSATRSLLERRDVIIVASVSCIYGLGSPEKYQEMLLQLKTGQQIQREDVLRKLVDIQYERNDYDFHRGVFRVRGDVIEVFPGLRGRQGHTYRVFRRRSRFDQGNRSADRQDPAAYRKNRHLSRDSLCHSPGYPRAGGKGHQTGIVPKT